MVQKILVPADGQVHEIIVSAASAAAVQPDGSNYWSPPDPRFWSIFESNDPWQDPRQVTGLQLVWKPMDRLSQRPQKITLHSVSTLRRIADKEVTPPTP
jgi:hypothetical protein